MNNLFSRSKLFIFTFQILQLLIVFFQYHRIFCQNITFLSVQGDVYYTENNALKKASTGIQLPNNSKIVLSKQAYALLSNANHQIIELKTEGTYHYNDIQERYKIQPSSITIAYMQNLASQLNSNKSSVATNKNVHATALFLYQPPHQSYLMEDIVTFVWSPKPDIKEYIFYLFSSDTEIFKKEVQDTLITINIQPYTLKPNQCYYWQVISKGSIYYKSEKYCFQIYNPTQKENILKELQGIQNDLGNTLLAKALLACYYEEKKLLVEALIMYKQIADSGIQDYVTLYQKFIKKHQLKP